MLWLRLCLPHPMTTRNNRTVDIIGIIRIDGAIIV